AAGLVGLLVGLGALEAHPFSAPKAPPVATVSGHLTFLDVEQSQGNYSFSTKSSSGLDCLVMVGAMRSSVRLPACPLDSVPDGYQGREASVSFAGDQAVSLAIAGLTNGTVTRPLPDLGAPERRARRWLDAAALLVLASLALRLSQRRRLPV
ncbi:MAG: hypothetical protein KGL53_11890, partial [Elusimicrobia bacterium]|nr:hypothetical protein [Elusimicrobiota bacterium]